MRTAHMELAVLEIEFQYYYADCVRLIFNGTSKVQSNLYAFAARVDIISENPLPAVLGVAVK